MKTSALSSPGTDLPVTAGWMPGVHGWLRALPLAGLSIGLAVQVFGRANIAAAAWTLATLAVLGVLLIQVVTSLAKGDVDLDLVALL